MRCHTIPHANSLFAAIGAVNLLLASFWIETAGAETAAGTSQRVVEVPRHELAEIRQELKYLRERDAERQAWEASIVQRLPAPRFHAVGHRRASDGNIESPCESSDATRLPDCAGESCGCYDHGHACQHPLPQAPCI
ncbi:MAG: hypothetical protein ACC645_22700, partial [Pirellulales bacterium]